jgi:hypothetical protein
MAEALRAPTSSALGVVVIGVFVLVGFSVAFVIHDIRRVEERALLGADVDERRLNAWKDCFYFAQINVADHTASIGAVDQKFNELVVLDNGDPRLARVRVDQNLSFHRCPPSNPRPATRRTRRGGRIEGCEWVAAVVFGRRHHA